MSRKEFEDLETLVLPISKSVSDSVKHFIKESKPRVVIFDLHLGNLPNDLGELLQWLKKRDIVLIGIDSL